MNVLGLFDGMSCGQIALNRAGIKYDKYFACEIDKHAIKVTQANYPHTIQLGDVTKVKSNDLPKIDLLIGGSPCQGFSFAGKQLAFDDPRSVLFFEYVRLLKEYKPKYFLLENVKMKREHELVISKYLGIDPIEINSSLVTAQNRVRLYWTNIASKPFGLFGDVECTIPQPKDKGIVLKDILETEVDEKYYLKNPKLDFSGLDLNGKGNTLRASGHASQTDKHNFDLICVGAIQFGRSEEGKKQRKKSMANGKDHTPFQAKEVTGLNFEKMNTITSSQTKYNLVCYQLPHGANPGYARHLDKSPSMTTSAWEHNNLISNENRIRRLTPIECERLQTVPDNYTAHVSDSQRYRMLGNGWTVDVIAHILRYM
jgi:site-specific DNA-cytosine methylase